MRYALLAIPLGCLLACLPALAGDPSAPSEVTLLESVAASPLTLREAVGRTFVEGRRPLGASFALDTSGRLVLNVILRAIEEERLFFEAWSGPVHENGWVPSVRVLEEAGEIAEAARLHDLVEETPDVLLTALKATRRTGDQIDLPPALAAAPVSRDGRTAVLLSVIVDGEMHGMAFDPATGRHAPAASGAEPARVPVDVRTMPELVVPGAVWFNTKAPPSLAAWRGQPVLVLSTDPG